MLGSTVRKDMGLSATREVCQLVLPGHTRNCTNVHYTESGNIIIGRICLARYWLILSSALLAHSAYFMLGLSLSFCTADHLLDILVRLYIDQLYIPMLVPKYAKHFVRECLTYDFNPIKVKYNNLKSIYASQESLCLRARNKFFVSVLC